jgi:hypothetical protein
MVFDGVDRAIEKYNNNEDADPWVKTVIETGNLELKQTKQAV